MELAEWAEGKECFMSGLASTFPATWMRGLPLDTHFLTTNTSRSFTKATNAT